MLKQFTHQQQYCKTLFFRCILIPRFPYVETSLHFNFVDFPVNFIKQLVSCFLVPLTNVIIEIQFISYYCLHYIIPRNIAYHITEVLIFYADKLMVMGNCKNLRVFNFKILLKSRKIRCSRNIHVLQ